MDLISSIGAAILNSKLAFNYNQIKLSQWPPKEADPNNSKSTKKLYSIKKMNKSTKNKMDVKNKEWQPKESNFY